MIEWVLREEKEDWRMWETDTVVEERSIIEETGQSGWGWKRLRQET